jgi:hypothetical protein
MKMGEVNALYIINSFIKTGVVLEAWSNASQDERVCTQEENNLQLPE